MGEKTEEQIVKKQKPDMWLAADGRESN